MKRYFTTLLFFIGITTAIAQTKKTYTQFEITVPLKGNPDRDQVNNYTHEKGSWFIPDGISAKLGCGLHYKKWIGLGVHSGLEWKWIDKLVIAPVYGNLRLSPKVGEETRITLQLGLGKAIALGRGNLMGTYKKVSLGLQTSDDLLIFVEISSFGLPINNQPETGSVSLGIALISF